MSVKKNSSLRNALREMRVSEPQRLPKGGPSFKPPAETSAPIGKEVPSYEAPPSEVSRIQAPQSQPPQNEIPQIEDAQTRDTRNEALEIVAPRREVAQSESPQNEAATKEAAQVEGPQNEVAHNKHPQIEQPQSGVTQLHHPQNEAPRSESTRNEPPQSEAPRKREARDERTQNEATRAMEAAQIELPQIEQSSKTFFRLSDRAFSYPQLQQLSGDCFRLFIWMSSRGWRYLNSDGTLRASVSFIEGHTAMSHATISRCLKTLREERLIELLETDYKKGNVWSISPVAFSGCEPENLPPRSGGPQNEGPRKEAAATSKRDRSSLNLRDKPPQIEGQIRKIKKPKKLSQEGAQALFDRVAKIRAPEKQKTEQQGLMQLLETYEPSDLEIALAYVERYGTLSGEGCHSPFRYLTVAVDDVLHACRKKCFALSVVENTPANQNCAKSEREELEVQRKNAALAAFRSDLTDEEQSKVVSDFVTKEFTFGYRPSDSLATLLAAVQWFTDREVSQTARAV